MTAFRPMMLLAAAAFSLGLATAANAATIEVKMLNKGEAGAMVFEPALVQIAPGDTVKFVAVDKGHNAEIIDGLLPEGATPFKGATNEEVAVTLDVEGVYAVRCKPHFAMGMVMVISVGAPTNLEAIKAAKLPKKAKERIDAALGGMTP